MTQYYPLTLEDAITKYGSCVGIVYRIYCTKTGISYVGQTRDIGRKLNLPRVKSHYNALKRGCHPCRKLQAAWDATDGKSITDEVLEVIAPINKAGIDSTSKMLEAERRWIEQYDATGGKPEKDWHYRLKAEEIRTLKDLGIINNAALVYFILKLKNPWCDRPLKVNPLELAIEWDLPESSVYEAIAKLKEAEAIQINEAEIVISWSNYSQQECHSDNSESFQDPRMDSEISESILENQNEFQDPRMDSEIPENRSPKPSPENRSASSQTISDFSNFFQSLSEGEREIFLEFGRKKAQNLPHPPELPDKWIAANFAELHKQFLASPAGELAKKQLIAQTDWTQHPEWSDWLAIMREGVPRFVALGTCFDNKTRRAIADWADERGLIWGNES